MLLEETTTMLLGDVSSVAARSSGRVLERNSVILPDREISSPTVTLPSTVVEVEKTKRPLETRMSPVAFPWI